MTAFIRILIFAIFFIQSGESQQCNTQKEDENACNKFKMFSHLSGSFVGHADTISNLLGEIPTHFVKAMLGTMKKCIFNPTTDKTIANSFKFILFRPNYNQPEYIDGNDMLNGCNALKSSAYLTQKTIWLWPGWLNNCSAVNIFGEDFFWTVENAEKLVKRANAQVIAIDWGSSLLSCCGYPILLFCHMKTISDWMAKVIRNCATNEPSASGLSTHWIIAHSLGAQMSGLTAQSLSKSGVKLEKLIALDPAAPLFAKKSGGGGKCHGIAKRYANQTMVFMTNPGVLGIENEDLGDVNVLCNQKKAFCQHGCPCDSSVCNHIYATKSLFEALIDGTPLNANYLSETDQKNAHDYEVSIYEPMKHGLYNIESDHNSALQSYFKYRDVSEL